MNVDEKTHSMMATLAAERFAQPGPGTVAFGSFGKNSSQKKLIHSKYQNQVEGEHHDVRPVAPLGRSE